MTTPLYSGTKPCGICLDRHKYRFEDAQKDPYRQELENVGGQSVSSSQIHQSETSTSYSQGLRSNYSQISEGN